MSEYSHICYVHYVWCLFYLIVQQCPYLAHSSMEFAVIQLVYFCFVFFWDIPVTLRHLVHKLVHLYISCMRCVPVHILATRYTWRWEDSRPGLVLSLHHIDSGRDLNTSPQAWQQAPLTTEPHCSLYSKILRCYMNINAPDEDEFGQTSEAGFFPERFVW